MTRQFFVDATLKQNGERDRKKPFDCYRRCVVFCVCSRHNEIQSCSIYLYITQWPKKRYMNLNQKKNEKYHHGWYHVGSGTFIVDNLILPGHSLHFIQLDTIIQQKFVCNDGIKWQITLATKRILLIVTYPMLFEQMDCVFFFQFISFYSSNSIGLIQKFVKINTLENFEREREREKNWNEKKHQQLNLT